MARSQVCSDRCPVARSATVQLVAMRDDPDECSEQRAQDVAHAAIADRPVDFIHSSDLDLCRWRKRAKREAAPLWASERQQTAERLAPNSLCPYRKSLEGGVLCAGLSVWLLLRW